MALAHLGTIADAFSVLSVLECEMGTMSCLIDHYEQVVTAHEKCFGLNKEFPFECLLELCFMGNMTPLSRVLYKRTVCSGKNFKQQLKYWTRRRYKNLYIFR
jgi:hypothetical protein